MRHEFQPDSSTGATPPHEFSFEKRETELPEKASTTEAREEKNDHSETYHLEDFTLLSPEKYASHFHIKACLDRLYRRVDSQLDEGAISFANDELTCCLNMLEAMIDMSILSDELIDEFTARFIRYRAIVDERQSSQRWRRTTVPQFNTLSIRHRYLLYRVGVISHQEIQEDVINSIANLIEIETTKLPLFDHPEKIIKILLELNQTELADAVEKGAVRSIENDLIRTDEMYLTESMQLYEDLIRIYAVSQPTLAEKVLDTAFAHLAKFYKPMKIDSHAENYYRNLSRVRVRLWQLRDDLGLPEQPSHTRCDIFPLVESNEQKAWDITEQLTKNPQPWNPVGPLAQAKFFITLNYGGHGIIAEGLVTAGRAAEAIDTINKLRYADEFTHASIHLVRALRQAEIQATNLPIPASAPSKITNAPVVDHTMHREDEFQFNLPPVPDVSHLYPTDEHQQLAEEEAEREWHRSIYETLSPKPVIPPDE